MFIGFSIGFAFKFFTFDTITGEGPCEVMTIIPKSSKDFKKELNRA